MTSIVLAQHAVLDLIEHLSETVRNIGITIGTIITLYKVIPHDNNKDMKKYRR